MRKVSLSLEKGATHWKVGLAVYGGEEDELIKLVKILNRILPEYFPGVEVARQKAVRELLGEPK